jgi:hypothetical protein
MASSSRKRLTSSATARRCVSTCIRSHRRSAWKNSRSTRVTK